jgi:PAS domain S-box-containing protein/diguanylate cyclase (GGDEF)-like protein
VNPAPDSVPGPGRDDDAALEAGALLDALLEQSAVGVTIVDRELRVVRANRAFGAFGDRTPADVVGRPIADVLPQLASQIVPAMLAVLKSGVPAIAHEVVARDADDPTKTQSFRTFRSPVVAADGSIVGVASTVIEVTDLKRALAERDDAVARQRESDAAELASRRAENDALVRYRAIFEGAAIGIIRVDRTGRVVEVNPALEQMLGYTAAELAIMKLQEYTHADDLEENLQLFHEIMAGPRPAYQFEKRCFRKDGKMLWVRVTSVAERDADGQRNHAITMLEDITERKLAEHALREQAKLNEYHALHDALTGLANRRKLYADVNSALSGRDARLFALGLFDLDGFKAYNDAFGHPTGDALLARLGHRIADAIGDNGIAYRMGGDEFCVFTSAADPQRVLEDARMALCDQGDGFSIRCSRGVALVPSEATDLEHALQLADKRLYADKRTNRVSETEQAREALIQLIAEQRQELAPNTINVADLAAATAARLGLSREDITCTRIAAELHDIGKTALPDAILDKDSPLDGDEWAFLQRHTVIGERIVAAVPALARIAPIVRASHERPDGKGYPDGLTTEAIPIGARIVAVVDAFDAMISTRPYKTALSLVDAVAELRRCAGTQFDPIVVDAFAHVLEQSHRERQAA